MLAASNQNIRLQIQTESQNSILKCLAIVHTMAGMQSVCIIWNTDVGHAVKSVTTCVLEMSDSGGSGKAAGPKRRHVVQRSQRIVLPRLSLAQRSCVQYAS